MARSGNGALRAARQAMGLRSQSSLAEAVNAKARAIGLRVDVSTRTVRRWESADPPWPHAEHVSALEALFKRPITELGFTPPWDVVATPRLGAPSPTVTAIAGGRRVYTPTTSQIPASAAGDYIAVTASYRRLYWSAPAARLHRTVTEHAQLGFDMLPQLDGAARAVFAQAVSESSLLAGRLGFFDLQQPEPAQECLVRALQASYEADDPLLGAASLAHMAFIPAFSGAPSRAEESRDRIRAARAFSRRGGANAEVEAWLDAVEAEVETKFGNYKRALDLIRHAEDIYRDPSVVVQGTPEWMDWFSPVRLAGFKAATLMAAGRTNEARKLFDQILNDLPADAAKQRSIYLADQAAAAVVENDPELACKLLVDALDLLATNWYATAMDRVKAVRKSLTRWDSLPAVRDLDERLYDWHTTINAFMT
ncbi:helix-turn-helix transcriptional regulator [Nocardia cyriacigeorgica]|uniref:Helix-turn-helix transcriptional regulator n=1 Tax=Nocardia cyriacigeorgica TaxID=135487 RepID=A0A5R8P5G8_9NOCA|nr:helix-turn-helix transcriptional regulator [Nocardia cyriacigeorgica]TLF92942.1 helix-turn-helix transcriptional regulator [Nocardia cyriacigeorgica]